MAILNGNNGYLSIDGQVMNTWMVEKVTLKQVVGEEDTTMGFGVDYSSVAPKLKHWEGELAVGYDAADLATYKAKLESGDLVTLIYGPESNTAGKPKFEATVMLGDIDLSGTAVAKDKLMFKLPFRTSGTPVSTLTGDLAGTFA